jgi:magnesium transporter
MGEVVHRWDDNSDLLKYGVGALVHGLLDVIVDGHFEAVQAIDDQMEVLEGMWLRVNEYIVVTPHSIRGS